MEKKDLSALREEYAGMPLLEVTIDMNPYVQFGKWFDQAVAADMPEPNAMTLATINRKGRPSARVVLLKEFDHNGFIFYTNYQSNKGMELFNQPYAALVFFWPGLQRQVRIEGVVKQISDAESDKYFHSRPTESQLGAIVSPQSKVIPSRKYLEERYALIRKEYTYKAIKRPGNWGGFRVIAERIEFWQGQPSRLHDRILYEAHGLGWQIKRLAP